MSAMYGARGAPAMSSSGGMSGTQGNKIPKGYSQGQMSNFTPEMMQLFQQLMGNLGPDSYTARLAGGDQSLFDEMERPALQQFSGIQGNMASKYSGGGGGRGALGSRNSSGFQNDMSQASSNFAQDLQSKRQGLQRQAISDLQGMGNQLLGQRPFENFLKKNPDFLSQILSGGGDMMEMMTKLAPFLMML
ncbi:MAG TPA: hypothetical protein VMR37_08435 [Rhabdochlamydiaceae bacterium]|nr:hypothetical protein [Rhabdochlamydiaceae bacterium]